MRVLHGLEALRKVMPGGVVSVGNFDGMHRGHGRILQVCRELRQSQGGRIVVVTFEPHPLTVLRPGFAPPRLTPLGIKQEILERAGVDELIVLPPEMEVLNLSAEAFWEILRDEARVAHLVEGMNFSFGKGRGGDVAHLREWTQGSPVTLHVPKVVEAVLLDLSIVNVSSTLLRWLVSGGRMRDAAICLGRAYELEGEVIRGAGRGRKLNVPTANLQWGEQLLPAEGVYAGQCTVEGTAYPAAVSIGRLPTFDDSPLQVEAHLVGFSGDLYGRRLRLRVMDWLREQRRFKSVEALRAQIGRDIEEAVARSRQDPARQFATVEAGRG